MKEFDDLEIEYKFSRRRKHIGLMVTAVGKLVVTSPAGTSRDTIARALDHHRAWIARKTAARQAAWEPLKDGVAFFLGKPYRLRAVRAAAAPVELGREEMRVALAAAAQDPWKVLKSWYRLQAESLIRARVDYYGAQMRLTVGPVEMREWKRRWGECHPDGKLRFNWRLVMLPPEVVDYVVVHELAHLKVPGHNPRFWREVAAVLPDYAGRRQWLDHAGTPFLLWQA
jgi:predicted metal-dependent hydrolase